MEAFSASLFIPDLGVPTAQYFQYVCVEDTFLDPVTARRTSAEKWQWVLETEE
jgi:hypothetical protein